MVAGLRGLPRAGDPLRVTDSEVRARAVAAARSERGQVQHFERLEALGRDHFDDVVDPDTGEATRCAPSLRVTRWHGSLHLTLRRSHQ